MPIETPYKRVLQLIKEAQMGKYALPSFQRQFVWDEDDILDLIDSLINDFPIGVMIFWKTHNKDIDPFSKPLIDTDHQPPEVLYVIDGQQRLTSLLLLFNNWKITRNGEEITCNPITYNPATGKFYKGGKKGYDVSELIRAFCLNDIETKNKLTKIIPPGYFKDIEEKLEKIVDYPVSMYIIETLREDEKTFQNMAEAFIRINKYGVRINNLELMLSFLAGSIGGELKNKIRDIYERLYDKFEIDLQPVIRFVFSNFGLKQTQISKVEQFKGNIEKINKYDKRMQAEILDKSERALELTIEFLKEQLGINNSRLLPSQTPLVTIATYFYHRDITSLSDLDNTERKNIENWFILVNFHGHYSSQTDTKLDDDLELIKDERDFSWDKLLRNMQRKRARVRITLEDVRRGLNSNVLRLQGRSYLFLLYTILVKKGADDWSGVLLKEKKLTDLAKHHIFPREYLEEHLTPEDQDTKEILMNNLANITFINKEVNSEIGDTSPDEYLKNYINSAKQHFIPEDSRLWVADQYKDFLEYRIQQIYLAGKEVFSDIFE